MIKGNILFWNGGYKIEKDYEDDSRISGFFYVGYSTGEY